MCKLLDEFENLKTLLDLMSSVDLNFLSIDDLEEIEFVAEELDIKITNFFNEIDGMYNSDPRNDQIFSIWFDEVNSQYLEIKRTIEKILCK